MNCHDYILESLYQELHCDYLSDLKSISCRPLVKSYLIHADMSQHSLETWDYAYSYIFGQPSGASSLVELKSLFLQHL